MKEMNINDINELQSIVDEKGKLINKMVNDIVDKCCSGLDSCIEEVEKELTTPTFNIQDERLYTLIARIPIELYYGSSQLERQGIKEDLSKAIKTEKYNEALQDTTGTVALKTSIAEDYAQKETILHNINSRAYRKIKSKLEYAYELLQSLKKIQTARTLDKELTKQNNKIVGGY